MTSEEKKLETPGLADRLMKVYRALRIGDAGLVEINASGSTEEVLARVHKETTSKCVEWNRLTPVSVGELALHKGVQLPVQILFSHCKDQLLSTQHIRRPPGIQAMLGTLA